MNTILYRFLNAEYGLHALQTRHLKVGRVSELNDPLDCAPQLSNYPALSSDIHNQKFEGEVLESAAEAMGLLCFSEAVHDPVVWSHYADSHRGVALGFIFNNGERLLQVKYQNERATVDYTTLGDTGGTVSQTALEQGYSTKAPSWFYEKEHRMFIDLNLCQMNGKHYFVPMPKLAFKQLVLGSRCRLNGNDISRVLKHDDKVDVLRAKPNQRTYHMDLSREVVRKIVPDFRINDSSKLDQLERSEESI